MNMSLVWLMSLAIVFLSCPTLGGEPKPIEPWQKKAIIDVLNEARSTTVVPASNMKMFEWDESLAQLAQQFTNQCECKWKRYSNAFVAWCDRMPSPVAVAKWRTLRMAPYYDFETGQCINSTKSKEICRHPDNYEAMIYAHTERVGCAMTLCWPEAGNKALFHSCVVGGKRPSKRGHPFKVGERCSDCDVANGWKYCVDGLCSKVPPTAKPTKSPTTSKPTRSPTRFPTRNPTKYPTSRAPTQFPTKKPTKTPTSKAPTKFPTKNPTKTPTSKTPTKAPTRKPITSPTSKRQTTKAPTTKIAG